MKKIIKNNRKSKQKKRRIAVYFLCLCLLFTSCVDPSVMYSALGADALPSEAEAKTKKVLKFANGSVIVTVVCEDDEYVAGVTDTEAVAKEVLTPEQLQPVGEYSLLDDVDSGQDTIAYQQDSVAADPCDLCHICPTFLGICYFVWLLIFLLVIGLILFLLWRKRKEKSEREGVVKRGE